MEHNIKFLARKKVVTFEGVARFCVVTTGLERTTFSKWDDTTSRAKVREDRWGCPFALIDFRGILGVSRQGAKDMPFYNSFMMKFMEHKLRAMREPHVWLWKVEHEKLSVVTELYEETIKFEYNIIHSPNNDHAISVIEMPIRSTLGIIPFHNIFHNICVPAKTEGIVAINKAGSNKQVGAVSLIFLTYNALRRGQAPVKANNTFKKIYSIPHPPPKDLLQETLYTVFPALELRLEFYVSVLQSLAINGETVYNVCGGIKFMYAAMVMSQPLLAPLTILLIYNSSKGYVSLTPRIPPC